jgi:hypothetical protein
MSGLTQLHANGLARPDGSGLATTPGIARPSGGVLTLRGYGIRVSVERGHLLVEDGVGLADAVAASRVSRPASVD